MFCAALIARLMAADKEMCKFLPTCRNAIFYLRICLQRADVACGKPVSNSVALLPRFTIASLNQQGAN